MEFGLTCNMSWTSLNKSTGDPAICNAFSLGLVEVLNSLPRSCVPLSKPRSDVIYDVSHFFDDALNRAPRRFRYFLSLFQSESGSRPRLKGRNSCIAIAGEKTIREGSVLTRPSMDVLQWSS